MQETKKINPLIALAAVSVTVFSLVGIAMMTGVLPNSFSKSSDTALETAAPKATEKQITKSSANTPSAPKAPTKTAAAKAPAQPSSAQTRPEPAKAAAVCNNCGVVTSVNAIKLQGEGSGLGAVAGGVVGGLLGNQVGGGSGKKIATVAGAAGGAYAGHQTEKHLKSTMRYDVTVKMDDGSTQTFSYDSQPAFQAGSKVRVVNGTLTTG
ncbi:MAG: glycine zipper 2TM domain-containing protein [Burkholderiales bacterium]|nr:glycine zipper 2TM domain-containing protein [Burkholderiales bacterium]MDP2398317.1 glycine zipper 2TM domain-containing protein [Burkholderiales bacterium]